MAISGMPASRYFDGDSRGDGLVGLELDDQIDAIPDQKLGVLDRDLRLIAVVDDDELDVLTLGGVHQPRMNLARERAVLPLRAIPDPVFLPPSRLGGQPVAIVLDLLDEPAVPQRVEQPEAHPLAEACPLHDIAQPQALTRVLEGQQDLGRVDERLDEVGVVSRGPI